MPPLGNATALTIEVVGLLQQLSLVQFIITVIDDSHVPDRGIRWVASVWGTGYDHGLTAGPICHVQGIRPGGFLYLFFHSRTLSLNT